MEAEWLAAGGPEGSRELVDLGLTSSGWQGAETPQCSRAGQGRKEMGSESLGSSGLYQGGRGRSVSESLSDFTRGMMILPYNFEK